MPAIEQDRWQRAWRIAWLAMLIAIPLTSWYGSAWLEGLRGYLERAWLALVLVGGIAALLIGAAWILLRSDGRGRGPRLLLAAAACGTVLALVPPGPRWVHVLLFLPLGYLGVRAYGWRIGSSVVVLLAAGDETFQHVLPDRTGSLLDVGANAVAAAAGMALLSGAVAGDRP